MGKDTERIFKAFHQFLDEHGQEDMDPDEMERLLDQFLAQYDSQLDTRPGTGRGGRKQEEKKRAPVQSVGTGTG